MFNRDPLIFSESSAGETSGVFIGYMHACQAYPITVL
jgi:hypothetical protein